MLLSEIYEEILNTCIELSTDELVLEANDRRYLVLEVLSGYKEHLTNEEYRTIYQELFHDFIICG